MRCGACSSNASTVAGFATSTTWNSVSSRSGVASTRTSLTEGFDSGVFDYTRVSVQTAATLSTNCDWCFCVRTAIKRLFHIGDFCFWVPFLKQLSLRNCALNFVEICNFYVGKMIIKGAKKIFNSDEICRSYSDLNVGVIFGTQCILKWRVFVLHYFASKCVMALSFLLYGWITSTIPLKTTSSCESLGSTIFLVFYRYDYGFRLLAIIDDSSLNSAATGHQTINNGGDFPPDYTRSTSNDWHHRESSHGHGWAGWCIIVSIDEVFLHCAFEFTISANNVFSRLFAFPSVQHDDEHFRTPVLMPGTYCQNICDKPLQSTFSSAL